MKYIIGLFIGFFAWSFSANAQESVEQQVADTACVCLSKLDTAAIKSKANILKMQCLNEAIVKNLEEIQKVAATEQRREEDQEKLGIRGSIQIKVQNILAENCEIYALFEQKLQTQRQSGRGAVIQK